MKQSLRFLFCISIMCFGFLNSIEAQLTLPWTEDFESVAPDTTFDRTTFVINGLSGTGYSWGYNKPNTLEGRLRFNAGPGFSQSGQYAATLDDSLSNSTVSSHDLILTVDLSSYVGQGVELGFSYSSHNEDAHPGDSVWVRSGFTSPWVGLYDLFANKGADGVYTTVSGLNVTNVLTAAGQAIGSSVSFRFGQEDNAPAIDPTFVDGMSFDDINLSVIPPIDAGVSAILLPDASCSLGIEPVDVTVTNFGADTLRDFIVSVDVNGGGLQFVSITGQAIPPGGTFNTNFTPGFNLGTTGSYSFRAWTDAAGDPNQSNDSSFATTQHNRFVFAYPDTDDMESTPGNWVTGGALSSWALTTPNMPVINSAGGGQLSWVTINGSDFSRTDGYNNNEQSFVESQTCYDFTGLTAPNVRFSLWWDIEEDFDGAALQSSVDSGRTWQTIGAVGTGVNWYNNAFISGNPGGQSSGWSGDGPIGSQGWIFAEHPLIPLAGEPDVRFRFVFGSDGSETFDGFAFDNFTIYQTPPEDASVARANSPTSDCGLTANEQVSAFIRNLGTNTLGNIPVAYQVNGGPIVRERFLAANIAPGGTAAYAFTTPADLSTPGTYTIKVWTESANDPNGFNDTITITVVHFPNISTFPYIDNFETNLFPWVSAGTNNSWAQTTPALSFINGAASGQQAWVTANGVGGTVLGGHNLNEQSVVQAGACFDFTGVLNPRVRVNVWWECQTGSDGVALQSSTNGGLSWQSVGAVGSGTNWYNNTAIRANPGGQPEGWSGLGASGSGGWVSAEHPLTGLANQSNVLFRFAFGSSFFFANDGFAFDDFTIFEIVPRDAGVDSLISPPPSGCSLGSSETVSIRVQNYGTSAIVDLPIGYQINNDPAVLETIFGINLAPGASQIVSFTTTADFSALGQYDVKAWTGLQNDPNFFNDSLSTSITNIPIVGTFPYFEDFEGGPAGWISTGPADPWEFGTPNGTVINVASSGTNAWMTKLSQPYSILEEGYLESPCFDMSNLLFPMLRMDIWWETRSGTFSSDGAKVQYSTNNGASWRDLGTANSSWYNNTQITAFQPGNTTGWSGNNNTGDGSGGWLRVETLALPLGQSPQVKLRVLFKSDNVRNTLDGVAIDNIEILEAPFDLRATSLVSPVGGCGLGNAQVCFNVFNGSSNSFVNPTVSYSVNGANLVTETYNGTINPNSTVLHCFNTNFNFGPVGSYDLQVWVSDPADTVLRNDTITTTIISKNPVTKFPYFEDFDDTTFSISAGFSPGVPVIDLGSDWENSQDDNLQDWAVWSGPTSSRQGPPVGDHTTGSTKYLYVEDSGFENDSVILLSPCFDIGGLTNPQMRVWVYSQSNNAAAPLADQNEYFIDIIDNGTIVYNVQGPRRFTGPAWQQDSVDLSGYSGTIGFRFRVNNNNSTFIHDIAIDDFEILDVFANDVGVTQILQPDDGSCGTNRDSVFVVVRNFGTNPQQNIPIVFTVGGQTINTTYRQQLPSGESDTVFVGLINSLGAGTSLASGFTRLPGDQNRRSDSTNINITIIAPPLAPSMPGDSLVICDADSLTLGVINPDPNLNYVWYDQNSNVVATGDTINTTFLTQDTVFFVEASTGMNGLKITEVDLVGFPDFMEVQNTSEAILDATGWTVYVGDNFNSIDLTNTTNWPLGVFQPGEVQVRNTDFTSPFYFGTFLRWNTLPNNGWVMIVDDQCDLVDFVVWGYSQLDVADFSPAGIVGCRNINLGDYWNGPAITGAGITALHRVGDSDNNDASDWVQPTPVSPGIQNPGLSTGCISPLTQFTIVVEPPLGLNLTDQFVCGAATMDAGPGYRSYLWSTGDVSQTITLVDTTLPVSVTVSDRFGCTETDTAVLAASIIPTLNLGADTATCAGIVLDGGNPNCDYIWSTGTNTRLITFNGVTGRNLVWAECIDPTTGCATRDTIIITVRPTPDAGLPSILSLCDSGTVSVRPGVMNLPLLWSTSETTSSITVKTTGTYRVTVTDTITGCLGTDSVDVTVSPAPIVDIGTADTTVCSGTQVELDAGTYTGFVFYDWNNGQVSQKITATKAGTFIVTVTDFNQCQGVDSMIINYLPSPASSFSVQQTGPLDYDFFNTSSGIGLSFMWDFDDGTTSNQLSPSHTYQFLGTYNPCLIVTDSCGNSDTTCMIVSTVTSIDSDALENNISLFPNPTKDIVNVNVRDLHSSTFVYLTNTQGKVLYSETIAPTSEASIRIDLSSHASGMYLLTLRNEEGMLTRKVLKE
ncbi:MAG: PKD domain-containing protein [Bacteroidia bacterium]